MLYLSGYFFVFARYMLTYVGLFGF